MKTITKTNLPSLTALLLIFGACTGEKDFVGKHTTYFSIKVSIPNGFRQSTVTAQEYEDLCKLNLDIYRNGKEGPYSGECTMVLKKVTPVLGFYLLEEKKVDLEMTNFHMDGDTLVFSLESGMMLSFLKLKAKLYRYKGSLNLGLEGDKFARGLKMGEGNGPFFVAEHGGFLYFSCMDQEESQETVHDFFSKQEEQLEDRITKETDGTKKKILENSLDAVKSKLQPDTTSNH